MKATTKTGVFFGIILLVAIIADRFFPAAMEIPRAAIIGVFAIVALLFITSLRPFLIWKSPSLVTYDGIFPLHGLTYEIAKSRNPNCPDMVVLRSGYNVGQYGIGRGEAGVGGHNTFFVTPVYMLEEFIRHFILHGHLYRPKHNFTFDYPWIGEVLNGMGYRIPKPGESTLGQTLLASVGTFMEPDEEYEQFNVKEYSDSVSKALTDIEEPKRMAIEDILNMNKKIRQARGGSQQKPPQTQPPPFQPPINRGDRK